METQTESMGLFFEHSSELDKLFEALAKAQSAFPAIKKERTNPFFKSKYADLQAVIDAIKKPLSDNGLSIVQLPGINGTVVVTTILGHASGQWMRATLKMPTAKGDAQGIGSAITYARRYSLQAIVNVSAEEDDDGNAAVNNKNGKAPETGGLSPAERKSYLSSIFDSMNHSDLQAAFKAAFKAAKQAGDEDAVQAFIDAKDQRKEELQ